MRQENTFVEIQTKTTIVLPIQEIKGKNPKDWYLERQVKIRVKTIGNLGGKKAFKVVTNVRSKKGNKKLKKRFGTTVPQGTGGEGAHRREIIENKTTGNEDINSLIRHWKP